MSWADRKKGIELRTLLTTSHSLVLGLGILLVGLGVFKALSMHTNMHNTMEMKRALLYGIKDVLGSSGEEGLRPNRATISCPAGLAERANALTARIANAGRFVVIYDENDNIIAEEYPKRFKGSLPDRLPPPYKTWRFGKGPDSWQAVALPVQSGGERYTVVVGIMWFPYEILIFHIARGQLFIFALTMLLGLIASRVVASQISKPVEDLAEVARKVSQGDLSQRSKGSTSPRELAQLSRDFNGMLTQLEGSFEAQQRFIADASHELKSPLTSISGMAELLRRGALKRAEDTEMVVSTIEREVDRMDRLVNDLLDLSEAEHQATKLVPVELASLIL